MSNKIIKDSDILKLARKELNKSVPYQQFICYAIRIVGERSPKLVERCNLLEEWICQMISPYFTVMDWLNIKMGDEFSLQSPKEVLAYRKAWLDYLIVICEKEENESK